FCICLWAWLFDINILVLSPYCFLLSQELQVAVSSSQKSYSLYMVKFKSDVLCQPNVSWSMRQRRPSELWAAHSA
ncbi:hypothetical protein B0H14DRAFT_2875572, partial [Mycena olivaceomarginata]